jgi:hypothetical protein
MMVLINIIISDAVFSTLLCLKCLKTFIKFPSLHSIKDEMYLRQNMQKQKGNLAYASVAYTVRYTFVTFVKKKFRINPKYS